MIFIFDVWRSALKLFTVGKGQARLTQGHTSPLGLIDGGHFIFISQIANVVCGEIRAWVGTLSHWVPDAEPLLTISHHQWISPLITITWRRRHLSTVINGAICDWRRMCTTLNNIHCKWQYIWWFPSWNYLVHNESKYGYGHPYHNVQWAMQHHFTHAPAEGNMCTA